MTLTDPELERLRQYAAGVIDHTLSVLGPITLGAGTRTTRGTLRDNRPTDGGRHNCTTWITAPIGDAGETWRRSPGCPPAGPRTTTRAGGASS